MLFENTVSSDPYEPTVPVCIIVEKVYDSCLQRECFPAFPVLLPTNGCPPFTFVKMTFLNGVIVPSSIVITPLPAPREDFARVQFTIQIPFTLTLRDSTGALFTISGNLPDINKDIVLFFPPTRPEFDFNLRVETRTEVLFEPPTFTATTVEFAIGSFVIAKITGVVQLQIPEFGFCPEPPPCEEFIPENPCVDFDTKDFPDDFFPKQQSISPYDL